MDAVIQGNVPQPDDQERSEIIIAVLRKYDPLKCRSVGPSVLRGIANKAQFGAVTGGRMYDMASSIGILSGLATLVDLSIKVIRAYRTRHALLDDAHLSIIHEDLSKSEIANELVP
jgi:hypothetical protein